MPESPGELFTATITTRRDEMTLPQLAQMFGALTALGDEVAVLRLAVEDRRYRYYPLEEWTWIPRFGGSQYREYKPRVL